MKKQRIFISSTYSDLTEYREAVKKAIRKTEAIDVSMEDFGSRDNRPVDECLRIIENEINFFIGIYAHRYGYIPKKEKVSITELEYKHAKKCKIPILIFVIDEDQPWIKKYIDFGKKANKLEAFKRKLSEEKMLTRFTNKDNLASLVVSSLIREINYNGIESIESVESREITSSYDWNKHRDGIYDKNRRIFLTHISETSTNPEFEHDIFIYLIKHKNKDGIQIKEVDSVDFFLGPAWGDKTYRVINSGGLIGIKLRGWGGFLCTCQVNLKNGKKLFLNRYIDLDPKA
ncbi:MAG: DUF4062 domain-containing protein [Bacteroidota bacterium]